MASLLLCFPLVLAIFKLIPELPKIQTEIT
jgi:hypothetical protein